MSGDEILAAGCERAAAPPDGPGADEVRRRLIAEIEKIDSVDDLEFLELMATLREMPFSEEAAVEVLVSAASYVAEARARFELELARRRR